MRSPGKRPCPSASLRPLEKAWMSPGQHAAQPLFQPYGSTGRENGLSSRWHRPYQIVRRGCRVHVVPATWLRHPCRIREGGARRRGGITSHRNAAGTQEHQRSGAQPVPRAHGQQEPSGIEPEDAWVSHPRLVAWYGWCQSNGNTFSRPVCCCTAATSPGQQVIWCGCGWLDGAGAEAGDDGRGDSRGELRRAGQVRQGGTG